MELTSLVEIFVGHGSLSKKAELALRESICYIHQYSHINRYVQQVINIWNIWNIDSDYNKTFIISSNTKLQNNISKLSNNELWKA